MKPNRLALFVCRLTAVVTRLENGERTRLGCSSTRPASNLRGACDRIESPANRQPLAGGRGVRQNARGRACSPNTATPLEVWLPLAALLALQFTLAAADNNFALRPPAVPLVTHDPYFSIWSPADKLTEEDTVHWTGKSHRLRGQVLIDGKVLRVMGQEAGGPALPQSDLEILPTRTIYTFAETGVRLKLTFMTPALPWDIDVLSRPVTYVTWEAQATDGKEHSIYVTFVASAELAVNTPEQEVVWDSRKVDELTTLKFGSKEQPILAKKGDDLRLDWGYLYVAAPQSRGTDARVIQRANSTDTEPRPPAAAKIPSAQLAFLDVKVSSQPVSRWLMLAYDDLYSIQYMRKNLRPYWRRNGWEATDLLKAAARDYEALTERCAKFDEELMADLT